MVGTIIPMVHGDGTRSDSRWIVLYALGILVGTTATGACLGAAGGWAGLSIERTLDTAATLGAVALLHMAFALRELGVLPFPVPQVRVQVPRRWQQIMTRPVAVWAYGVVLGGGLFTRIRSTAFHATLLWTLLSGRPAVGVLLFAAFGVGKLLPLTAMAALTRRNEELNMLLSKVAQLDTLVEVTSAFLLATEAGFAIGWAGPRLLASGALA